MMAGMLEDVSPVTGVPPATQDGVLNVRKPAGCTSHDVVADVRRRLRMRKVGHAGTLDPDAVGVLPILLGQGTRLSSVLVDWDKEYEAVLRLGRETTTQDAAGDVTGEWPTDGLSEDTVRAVMKEYRGPQWQVPPMYSAVKVGGRSLYKAARAGKTLDRRARAVHIYHLEITALAMPDVTFLVRCSKGTYIRTLCADIGRRLGVGGHLHRLTRTRVGPLRLDCAVSLDELVHGADLARHGAAFLTLDGAVAHLPSVVVGAGPAEKVCHGMPLADTDAGHHDLPPDTLIRVKDEQGRLLALAQWTPPSPDVPNGAPAAGRQLRMVMVFGARA